MSARNRFFMLLGIIFLIAATYYYFSTDHSKDLVLIGTVDANQVMVSAQVEGRIQKLLVDEGTPVKAGDLIAILDPSELKAQAAAATATIASLQQKVEEMQHTERSTSGSTSSDVANAEAKVSSAKAQLLQAQASLERIESDSRRTIELAKAGIDSDQERVQAETNLRAAQATVGRRDDQQMDPVRASAGQQLWSCAGFEARRQRRQDLVHGVGIGPCRHGLVLRAPQLGGGHHLHCLGDLLRRLDASDPEAKAFEAGHLGAYANLLVKSVRKAFSLSSVSLTISRLSRIEARIEPSARNASSMCRS